MVDRSGYGERRLVLHAAYFSPRNLLARERVPSSWDGANCRPINSPLADLEDASVCHVMVSTVVTEDGALGACRC